MRVRRPAPEAAPRGERVPDTPKTGPKTTPSKNGNRRSQSRKLDVAGMSPSQFAALDERVKRAAEKEFSVAVANVARAIKDPLKPKD